MIGERFVSLMVVPIIYFLTKQLHANQTPFNCRISEFYCRTGRCIPIDKFCNGIDDCNDKSDEPPYCSRKCRHESINLSNLVNELNEKGIYEFVWVIDFPLLEVNELGELKSTHHPFTHPHPEDMGMIPDEAMNARSLAYDLVLNGSEIGGGSIRVHNSELQKTILKILGLQEEDFSHLLEALQMGCPPHGGIALGVDRLFAILCDCRTIKNVIAFPKATFGQDLMTNCPSDISNEDKIRYHIPIHENSDSSPQSSQDEEL